MVLQIHRCIFKIQIFRHCISKFIPNHSYILFHTFNNFSCFTHILNYCSVYNVNKSINQKRSFMLGQSLLFYIYVNEYIVIKKSINECLLMNHEQNIPISCSFTHSIANSSTNAMEIQRYIFLLIRNQRFQCIRIYILVARLE